MTAAESTNTPQSFQPDQHLVAGRYRLRDRIGRGRLGDIFSAVDEQYEALGVEQHVAIQIVSDIVTRNNTLFNKLNTGYESLRAAAHPNLVNYHCLGRDKKFVYLVMELLDGGSLRLVLDDAETLPVDEVLPVIRGVGEALQLLHAKDLVHGNVTPGNVFINESLDVLLLDVVPRDAPHAISRGVAVSEASTHATAEDDVLALACLAYQMLAGKHPFNHGAPPEIGLAGLEPDRIRSLSDHAWAALRRALALDEEERTTSVAEFLRDFGIKGTERLRPAVERPVEEERPIEEVPPPVARPVTQAPQIVVPEPASSLRLRKKRGPLRALLLALLLASLGTWIYYGQPEERIVELIAFADETMNLGLVEVSDPPQAVEPPIEQPVQAVAEAAEPETVEPEAVEPEVVEPEVVEPVVVESDVVEPEAVVLTESFVSVSERDASARIVLQRNDESGSPLVWWTSEHTAKADTDFVPVPQQVVYFGSGDPLHIPLVNDSLPERPESFFVHFGLRHAEQGNIERVATVRVDINDDDL